MKKLVLCTLMVFYTVRLFGQPIVIDINLGIGSTMKPIPHDQTFFLKVKVDSQDRLSQVFIYKTKIYHNGHKGIHYKDSVDYLNVRELKLAKYSDSNTDQSIHCYQSKGFWEGLFSNSKIKAIDSPNKICDKDVLNSLTSKRPFLIYELNESSIRYERVKDLYAYIEVPQLSPRSTYGIAIMSKYLNSEIENLIQISDSVKADSRTSIQWATKQVVSFSVKERTGISTIHKEDVIKIVNYISRLSKPRENYENITNFIVGLQVSRVGNQLASSNPFANGFSSSTIESFEKETERFLVPEFGTFTSISSDNRLVGVLTVAGVRINFTPIDSEVQFRKIKYKDWKYRTSLFIGATIPALTSFGKSGERVNLIGDINLITSLGLRLNSFTSLNIGGVLFKAIDPNPAINSTEIKMRPIFGVTFDLKLQKNLPGLFGAIK